MENIVEQKQERKPYETPAVVFESALEVRAGTPIPGFLSDLTDPAGLQKQR
ncbi:MAG: hypothetical protein NT169_23425 [Chloroflexi bacterium]|nr:hypothetical protein [Chloroflexota bacterium]